MNRVLPSIAFGCLALAAGLLNGIRTDRWSASADGFDLSACLDAIPTTIGDWQGVPEPIENDDRHSQLRKHVSYRYRNALTGEKVSLLLVCGRPGPVSVHTPDVCYGGAGFQAIGQQFRKDISIDNSRHVAVAAMRFKSPATAGPSQLEVCWAWNGGNGWEAPDSPRWALAHHRILYKLYVVRDVSGNAIDDGRDPTVAFMRIMLPRLERSLSY